MEQKIVKFQTVKAIKQDKRVLRFVGSDEKVDRDGDKVMLDGWKLKDYRKNPVVLFGHNYAGAPVARTKKVWIDKTDKKLLFDIEFPESDISSVGDSLYKLYSNGFMNATSVGFLPDYDKIVYPEKKMNDGTQRIINGQTLAEISLVSVGVNQRALLTSKSMEQAIEENVIDQLELDELMLWVKEEKLVDDKIIEIKSKNVEEKLKTNINKNREIELESKIAELELQLIDKEIETEIENDIYAIIYDEYVSQPEKEEEVFMNEIIDTLKEEE